MNQLLQQQLKLNLSINKLIIDKLTKTFIYIILNFFLITYY